MPKMIAFDQEAQESMRAGVSKLARAVRVTLGPKGRNVILQKSFGSPTVTKDGVTVAREIELADKFEDMGARILGTAPPASGTRFAVIDFPPDNKPHMHRTETIDYVLVLSGEIEMDMDASSVKLKAGDVMVQRGTNHAWVNRSSAPARVAFVLIDAEPLGLGKPVIGTANARSLAFPRAAESQELNQVRAVLAEPASPLSHCPHESRKLAVLRQLQNLLPHFDLFDFVRGVSVPSASINRDFQDLA